MIGAIEKDRELEVKSQGIIGRYLRREGVLRGDVEEAVSFYH